MTELLHRASEVGLLTADLPGYFAIHPALPWFFKTLFDASYPAASNPQSPIIDPQLFATRAFVEQMGWWGTFCNNKYSDGNRFLIAALTRDEANLLYAHRLARTHGWWDACIRTMKGLYALYSHTGRRAELVRLVEEIVPDLGDAVTNVPIPGREEHWLQATEFRVYLAIEARQWEEAERLQRGFVDWHRRRAAFALAAPPESLDALQRNSIQNFSASLNTLAMILRDLERPGCVTLFQESLELIERIGDQAGSAVCAFNLGQAYETIDAVRNLGEADRWFRCSLDLCEEQDRLGRSRCFGSLGAVAFKRFKEAREAELPEGERLSHLNAAIGHSHQALDLLPPDAINDRGVIHHQLGNIYGNGGILDRAFTHYRESVRCFEIVGDLYKAAHARFDFALGLATAGRLADAREYAYAALRNVETYGDRLGEQMQRTERLIAKIEQAINAQQK